MVFANCFGVWRYFTLAFGAVLIGHSALFYRVICTSDDSNGVLHCRKGHYYGCPHFHHLFRQNDCLSSGCGFAYFAVFSHLLFPITVFGCLRLYYSTVPFCLLPYSPLFCTTLKSFSIPNEADIDLEYGCGKYDYKKGTVICVASGQIGGKEDNGEQVNQTEYSENLHRK